MEIIKYNKKSNTFRSTYKEFSPCDITANVMYGWVRQGQISFVDFKVWISFQTTKPSQ